MLRLSPQGIAFIKRHEGLKLQLYHDVAGFPTIGYGHLIAPPELATHYRDGIAQHQAEVLLRRDIQQVESAMQRLIHSPLNDPQFAAIASFTFNLGSGALQRSTLRRRLNRGEYHAIPAELLRWVYAGGRKHRGLLRRRHEEGALFCKKP